MLLIQSLSAKAPKQTRLAFAWFLAVHLIVSSLIPVLAVPVPAPVGASILAQRPNPANSQQETEQQVDGSTQNKQAGQKNRAVLRRPTFDESHEWAQDVKAKAAKNEREAAELKEVKERIGQTKDLYAGINTNKGATLLHDTYAIGFSAAKRPRGMKRAEFEEQTQSLNEAFMAELKSLSGPKHVWNVGNRKVSDEKRLPEEDRIMAKWGGEVNENARVWKSDSEHATPAMKFARNRLAVDFDKTGFTRQKAFDMAKRFDEWRREQEKGTAEETRPPPKQLTIEDAFGRVDNANRNMRTRKQLRKMKNSERKKAATRNDAELERQMPVPKGVNHQGNDEEQQQQTPGQLDRRAAAKKKTPARKQNVDPNGSQNIELDDLRRQAEDDGFERVAVRGGRPREESSQKDGGR